MWLLWELLRSEDLIRVLERYQLKLSTLNQMAETKAISWETWEEIKKIMQEKRGVPM